MKYYPGDHIMGDETVGACDRWKRSVAFHFSFNKCRGDNAPISTNNKSPTDFNADQQHNVSFIGPTDPGIKHAVGHAHSSKLEAEVQLHSFVNSTLDWLNPSEVLRLQSDVSVICFVVVIKAHGTW